MAKEKPKLVTLRVCFDITVEEPYNIEECKTLADLPEETQAEIFEYINWAQPEDFNVMVQTKSKTQAIWLELIRMVKCNRFNGEKIVQLLLKHQELWKAVTLERDYGDLIGLRDMSEGGEWSADTLYIVPVEGKEEQLEQLARQNFDADEVVWVKKYEVCERFGEYTADDWSKKLLKVWWD